MLTFTVGGRGRGVYTKLRLINEIKSYVTYLIANSTADIYFFSNIEVGTELSNPHLHSQIWFSDKEAVRAIYDKVIDKFALKSNRCKMSEPQLQHDFYNYVIKDYSKNLNDNDLWNLEQTKKRMRKTLGFKLRFYSKSKSKYSQKTYRYFYRAFGVLRVKADKFVEWFFGLFFRKKIIFKNGISSFISIKNKKDIVFLMLGKRLFLNLFFIYFYFTIEILFYSPATSPPMFIFIVISSLYVRHCVFEVVVATS